MEVYPCPICGKEVNRRGRPFTDPSATEAHITGAHDASHKHERGESHRDEIEAVEREESYYETDHSPGGNGSVPPEADLAADLGALRERFEDIERVKDRETGEVYRIDEGVELSLEMLSNPEAFGLVHQERVRALEGELAERERVIGELVEMVEILVGAVDQRRLREAQEAWGDGELDTSYWDEDMYPFKESRYR